MAVWTKMELLHHKGHHVDIESWIDDEDNVIDVAVICRDCEDVLVSMQDLETENIEVS